MKDLIWFSNSGGKFYVVCVLIAECFFPNFLKQMISNGLESYFIKFVEQISAINFLG